MNASNIAATLGSLPGSGTLDAAFTTARDLGFSAFALFAGSRAVGVAWDEATEAEREQLIALRGTMERGAIHAPFVDLPLVSPNAALEREVARQVGVAIRAAGALRCEVVTVHAYQSRSLPLAESMPRLINTLRAFGDLAAEHNTRIGVENISLLPTPEEQVGLIDAVNHPAVGATLDTGHTQYWFVKDGLPRLPLEDGAAWYNARLMRLMDALGDRIIHVHVQDTALPEMLDQHLPVGAGMIDFAAVIERLDRFGYTRLLEMEQRLTSLAQLTEGRDRLLAMMPAAALAD